MLLVQASLFILGQRFIEMQQMHQRILIQLETMNHGRVMNGNWASNTSCCRSSQLNGSMVRPKWKLIANWSWKWDEDDCQGNSFLNRVSAVGIWWPRKPLQCPANSSAGRWAEKIGFQIKRDELEEEMMKETFGHGLTFQTAVFRTRKQRQEEENNQVYRFSLKNNLFHYSHLMTRRAGRKRHEMAETTRQSNSSGERYSWFALIE